MKKIIACIMLLQSTHLYAQYNPEIEEANCSFLDSEYLNKGQSMAWENYGLGHCDSIEDGPLWVVQLNRDVLEKTIKKTNPLKNVPYAVTFVFPQTKESLSILSRLKKTGETTKIQCLINSSSDRCEVVGAAGISFLKSAQFESGTFEYSQSFELSSNMAHSGLKALEKYCKTTNGDTKECSVGNGAISYSVDVNFDGAIHLQFVPAGSGTIYGEFKSWDASVSLSMQIFDISTSKKMVNQKKLDLNTSQFLYDTFGQEYHKPLSFKQDGEIVCSNVKSCRVRAGLSNPAHLPGHATH